MYRLFKVDTENCVVAIASASPLHYLCHTPALIDILPIFPTLPIYLISLIFSQIHPFVCAPPRSPLCCDSRRSPLYPHSPFRQSISRRLTFG